MKKAWESYDPYWLIEIAKEQIPERPEIIDALRYCKKGIRESRAYIYFVESENPNKQDFDWQFKENIILEDRKHGTIVLDVLSGNRIGGIEFVKYVK